MLATLQAQIAATSSIEWVAVVAAIAYLLLAIRENIWCWLFAAISSASYICLFINALLYMESLLNAYYLAMAGYGLRVWSGKQDVDGHRPVVTWPWQVHIVAIPSIVALSAGSAWLLSTYTDAALPFYDSLTTFGAFWTTFLVARKVFENWWYWLVIDAGSILLYLTRDLYLTSLLFVVYLAMIPFGIVAWKRS
ncbi:MAG: nicotinamide riboside transporter PnuC, partial [Woeseiaceae bacterium]|nr:nicotinamide riboside transporter PnuC [Woeseiaceae bacterium]